MKKRLLSLLLVLTMVASLFTGLTVTASAAGAKTATIVLGDFVQDGDTQLKQHTLMGIPYKGAVLSFELNEAYRVKVLSYSNSSASAAATIAQESDWLSNSSSYTLPSDLMLMRVALKKADDSAISPSEVASANLVVSYTENCNVVTENQTVADLLKTTTMPVLIHGSDFHGDVIRADRFMEFAQYIGADQAFMTGDFTWDAAVDLGTAYKDMAANKYSSISNKISFTVGNHDVQGTESNLVANKLFADGKTYYYKDDTANSLRYIVLDDSQLSTSSYAQVKWLVETLKSTPDGYGIFIAQHSPDRTTGDQPYQSDISWFQSPRTWDTVWGTTGLISGIVDAFISRGEYKGVVNADFSDMSSSAEFIAHITGHTHNDALTYVKGTEHRQLLLNVARANAGIKGVEDDLARSMNNRTQDCFNAYVIDRTAHQVTAYRIGANTTKAGTDRSSITLSYSSDVYHVVFHENASDDADLIQQIMYTGQKTDLQMNSFTRVGYAFAGWATKPDGKAVYQDGQTVYNLVASHKTADLYAVWKPFVCEVSFNGNGAISGTMQTRMMGNGSLLPVNQYINPGVLFVGWNTAPDGSGTAFSPGGQITFADGSNSVTLYAQWEAFSADKLPDGYTAKTYIESDGKSYIDTGVIPNQDTEFDVDFITLDNVGKTGYGTIFGTRTSSKKKEYSLSSYCENPYDIYSDAKSHGIFRMNEQEGDPAIPQTGVRISVSFHDGILTNSVGMTHQYASDNYTAPCSLTVFALNENGTKTQYGKVRLYSLKLYSGDTLIRDFVPCVRDSDGAVGLMDVADGHNQFYGNLGSGTFTASDNDCIISFVPADAEFGAASLIRAENGDSVCLPTSDTFSRSGYKLSGWTDSLNGAALYECGETITVNSNLELYPAWVKITKEDDEIYLSNTKGAYINTGVIANQATGFDIDFVCRTLVTSLYHYYTTSILDVEGWYGSVFGARKSSQNSELQLTTYSGTNLECDGILRWGNARADAGLVFNKRMSLSLRNRAFVNANEVETTFYSGTFTSPCAITLFAINEYNNPKQFGVHDVYSLKFYDGDELIRDFVPTEKDGKVGLWDKVGEQFYGNSGTGELFLNHTVASISFDANAANAVGTMDDQIVLTGQTYYLAENAFTNGAYSFISWNTKSDGTGETYFEGQEICMDSDSIDLKLYAQWALDPAFVPAGLKINAGSDYLGEVVDGTAGKSIVLEYIAPANVAEELDTEAEEQLSLSDDQQYLDTIEVNLYVNDGGMLIPVKDVVLSDNITVKVPYEGAVVGETYTLYHWNGTCFDGPITATVEVIDSVPYLVFEYNKFSPFVIIGGVNYWNVSFADGEGYFFTYPNGGLAKDGEDYTFTLTLDSDYENLVVRDCGAAITEESVSGNVYTYKLTAVAEPHNITAAATPKAAETATIKYNVNGANEAALPDETYEKGSIITLLFPELTRTGYTFVGWNTAADGTGDTYARGGTYKLDADVELFAKWSADPVPPTTYTVTYEANGGDGTVPNDAANYAAGDIYFVMGGENLSKTGFEFKGWATANDAAAPDCMPGSSYAMGTANVTLYAVWAKTADVWTITWKDWDGATLDVDEVEAGKMPAFIGATPRKDSTAQYDYTFDKWSPAIVAATADATYTATYTETAREYTVNWFSDEGLLLKTEQVEYGTTPNYGTAPAKTGDAQYSYTFDAWTPAVVAVERDADYYATYTQTLNKYTVTWKNGTDVLETDTDVEYGTMPEYNGAEPTKAETDNEVYTFSGWAPAVASVTGSVTYSAQFTITPKYTVHYELNGGTSVAPADAKYASGTDVLTAEEPTNPGYVFTGWKMNYGANNNVFDANALFTVDRDVTLTAQWEPSTDSGDVFIVASSLVNGSYGADYTADLTVKSTADASEVEYPDIHFALVDEDGFITGSNKIGDSDLELDEQTGEITGKPAEIGEISFRVVARNVANEDVSQVRDFTITVGKAVLTATYDGETIAYGEEPAYPITVTGFMFDEDEDTADGYEAPTVSTDETDVGEYELTPEGGEADNYTFAYASGILKIVPKEIETVSIDVTAPVATMAPQAAITDGDYFTGTISWEPADSTFAYNTVYTATVVLTPDSNHKFTTSTDMDGWNFIGVDVDGNISFTKEFAKTEQDTVKTPVIDPRGGSFRNSCDVTITCATEDAVIYYTTDGSNPTIADTEYTGAFTITSTTTVKAIAVKEDYVDSAVASVKFTKKTASPSAPAAPEEYTLTFVTNGGSKIASVTGSRGKTIKLSRYVPEKKGYEFDGWYSDKNLTKAVDEIKLTGNKTVYAKWSVENPFIDVFKTDYFYDAVVWAYENEITLGTSAVTFSPEETCSRGQVVTFLWRAAGCPAPKSQTNPFTDVKESDYFYEAVLWAVENNITVGTSETTFAPESTCTNAQIVTFVYRAITDNIGDNGETWYAVPVAWAEENGLLAGTYADAFTPNADAPRCNVVVYLYRYANK